MITAGCDHRTVSPMSLLTLDLSVQSPAPPAFKQLVLFVCNPYHQDQNSTLR